MSLIPYDDRNGLIWFGNGLVPWREARLHVLTHALHYGSAVFEGLRCYDGRIFKLREHMQRLSDGCIKMDMKPPFSVEDMMAACEKTVKENAVADGYLRPIVWRGAEQMGICARETQSHFAVAAWAWPSYFPPDLREKGIRLKTSAWRRPAPDCAPTDVKASGLYMICTLSKHVANAEGFDDALMLDHRGHVAELTGANFFMVRNGALYTPPADCFLDGITRQTVMGLAREEGIDIVEKTILPTDLADATECFATGTAAEVTAIGSIDGHAYTVGPITRKLRDRYENLVRGRG